MLLVDRIRADFPNILVINCSIVTWIVLYQPDFWKLFGHASVPRDTSKSSHLALILPSTLILIKKQDKG
jgi:hypothetical protein